MINRTLLVVGGGIAGMALAIRMRESGWRVSLIEKDPQWRVYGAGISITAPTYRAFKRLGLLAELVAQGYASHGGVRICAPNGHVLLEQAIEPLEPGLPTHGGIMRPVLHAILSARTRALGTEVRLGVTLESYAQDGAQVQTRTSDGRIDAFDLVVAADGIFSQTRGLMFPDGPSPRYTGQYCWRLVAPRPPEIDRCHFYMAGVVTAGLTPTSDTQMYMFLLHQEREGVRVDASSQWQQLYTVMRPFSGLIGSLRDSLSAESNIICRPLEAILLPRPWHRGHVLLLGDAVHATTPHLASGAGIAVEDSLVLSQELQGSDSIEAALERFEQRRWERCRLVVENSVRIGQMEQTHADPGLLKALMAESEQALRQDV